MWLEANLEWRGDRSSPGFSRSLVAPPHSRRGEKTNHIRHHQSQELTVRENGAGPVAGSPGFVVMFVPADPILDAAIAVQPTLWENARQIANWGREMYNRLHTYFGHIDKMGQQLEQAVTSYNASIGSLESRVLPQARQFEEPGPGHRWAGDRHSQAYRVGGPSPAASSRRRFGLMTWRWHDVLHVHRRRGVDLVLERATDSDEVRPAVREPTIS